MPRLIGPGFLTALAVALLLALGASQAFASHVQCGDVITHDTTLDSDLLDCPGSGIVIGADGITLDLNGHVVDGDGVAGNETSGCGAGIANSLCLPLDTGHDDVTITGGTVRDFQTGISIRRSASVVIARTLFTGNEDAVGLNDVTAATVERNVFQGNSAHSIHAIEADGARIERNRASANGDGIRLVSGVDGIIARNEVEDNGLMGITVEDGVNRNRIVHNSVRGNGHAGIVVFEGTRLNRVEHNAVSRNGNAPGFHFFDGGILVDHDNHVARNEVSGNSRGIVVWGVGRNSVVANSVTGNRQGIVLEEGEGDRVEGNRVVANSGDGITGGNRAVITRNVVALNGQDGIGAFTATRVAGNVVSGNGSMGVSPGGTRSQIERNLISGNGRGIWMDEPSVRENTIEANSVRGNLSEGIYLLEHADLNFVRGNLVSRNGSTGILVGDAGDSRIEGNRVWRNRIGIQAHDAYGLAISGNSVTANAGDGILVEPFGSEESPRRGHMVSDNVAQRNGDDGIDVENPLTTIAGNGVYTNVDLGIEAVAGVADGGANRAFGNGNPLQCLNVVCR